MMSHRAIGATDRVLNSGIQLIFSETRWLIKFQRCSVSWMSIFTLGTAFAWKGSEWWDICIFFLCFHPSGIRISLRKHHHQQCFQILLNKILGVTLNYMFIYVQALRTTALVNAWKERTRCPITDLIFTFWQCSFMYGIQIDEVSVSFVVAESPIHVWLFATLWTAAHQASLSFTIS